MTEQAALITGAARRVGRGIALALAGLGWDLGLHYGRSEREAESLAAEIRGIGRRCAIYRGDLRRRETPAEITARFLADFPRGSLLVNNASLFEHDTIEDFRPDLWEAHMDVNALAPTLFMKAFHEGAREKTCLINLLDQKVDDVTPDYFCYTVSKMALLAVTRMLARAYAPKSRVNAIAPGLLLPSGDQTVADFEREHHRTPLEVGPTVAEVAAAVAFIAATPSMTGQVITIDGGEHFLQQAPPSHDPARE